ncbi:hypothetical protein J3F84DRAFT_51687 [Trichoderma pleuroticola]
MDMDFSEPGVRTFALRSPGQAASGLGARGNEIELACPQPLNLQASRNPDSSTYGAQQLSVQRMRTQCHVLNSPRTSTAQLMQCSPSGLIWATTSNIHTHVHKRRHFVRRMGFGLQLPYALADRHIKDCPLGRRCEYGIKKHPWMDFDCNTRRIVDSSVSPSQPACETLRLHPSRAIRCIRNPKPCKGGTLRTVRILQPASCTCASVLFVLSWKTLLPRYSSER